MDLKLKEKKSIFISENKHAPDDSLLRVQSHFVNLFNTSKTVGFLYPSFKTYKALKNGDSKELKPLCTYWIVLGAVSVVEEIANTLVSW